MMVAEQALGMPSSEFGGTPQSSRRARALRHAVGVVLIVGAAVSLNPSSARAQPIDIGGLTLGGQLPSSAGPLPDVLVGLGPSVRRELLDASGAVMATFVQFASPRPPGIGVVLVLDAGARIIAILRADAVEPIDGAQAAEIMAAAVSKYGPATLTEVNDERSIYSLYRDPHGQRFPADGSARSRVDACSAAASALMMALGRTSASAPTMSRVDVPPECGTIVRVVVRRFQGGSPGSVTNFGQDAVDLDGFRRAMTGTAPRPRL